jgi:hypothetical protein
MHLFVLLLALVTTGPVHPAAPGPHEIFGIVRQIGPNTIVMQRHNGQLLAVDVTVARETGRLGVMYVNRPVGVYGAFYAGHYRANAVTSANGIQRGNWPADY